MTETPILSPYGYTAKRLKKCTGATIAPFTAKQNERLDAVLGIDALQSKRNFVGIDLDPQAVAITKKRLTLRNAKDCASCALAEHCDAYDTGVVGCELFVQGEASR